MTGLIISVITIALIVATMAATTYYGGESMTQGRASADAATYVNAAQQIAGAAVMSVSTGNAAPTAVSDLITKKFLSSIPNVKSRSVTNEWTFQAGPPRTVSINLVGAPADNQKMCEQMNKNAGGTDMDSATGTVAAIGTLPYACLPGFTGTSPQIFQYKY